MTRSKKKPSPPAKPKPKAKRGRPRKAAVPAAEPVVPVTLQQAMQAVLDDAMQRAATGKPLAHHHHQALRNAWMVDMAQYVWSSVDVAAADLGVSPGTVRGYATQGCPGIEPHQPIAKHIVLTWLLRTAHDRGGKPGATTNDAEEVELDIRRAKLAKVSGQLVAEAEDRATQGVINRMGQLKHHLQNGVPGVLFEAIQRLAGDKPLDQVDRTQAEDAIAQELDSELRRFVPQRLATTAHGAQSTEPTHG
jgi:hypothetical protein